MGGRGASSGTYKLYGKTLQYGDEYRSLATLQTTRGEVKVIVGKLAKVDSAEWLINNLRNSGLDSVATVAEMRENRGRVRDATIQNFNGILRALQGGGFVDESVGGGTRRRTSGGAGRFW